MHREPVSLPPYEKLGNHIYERSFATIRAETDFSGVPDDLVDVYVRMIHACGQTDLLADIAASHDVVKSARAALQAGAPILCDANMVASGITRTRLPADNAVICTLRDDQVPQLASAFKTSRSAAAVELWADHLGGAVVAIGNAPTTLFHLLERLQQGWPAPAAIVGCPVGFIGAAESKEALAQAASTWSIPYLTVFGRRGGSAITSAAVNALACEHEILR